MTKRIAGILLCLLAIAALGACQTIQEKRKIDYKSTRTLPPLEVPPDLATPESIRGSNAVDPGAGAATYSEFTSETGQKKPAAGGETVLPVYNDVRIERSGQTRWLVVNMTPEQLWPRLHEFILSRGLIIDKENPQTGVLETDWAENRANVGTGIQKFLHSTLGSLYSTGTRDKYRFRLERGSTPGTTDIYVAHQGMKEIVVNDDPSGVIQTRWEPRSPDPGLEAEMLRLLMVSLGVKEEKAKTEVAAIENQPPPTRAKLEHQGDQVRLSVLDDFERAWRRVGLALDRSSFTVEDRDRSKGIYYVRYIDPDTASKEKGFLARWFGRDDDKKKASTEYQISLKESGSATRVEVLNPQGTPEASKTGNRILTLLYDQLK